MKSPDANDAPTLEAAYWLVALEEEPDNADLRARFEVWRRSSPANAKAWQETAGVYDLIGSPGYVAHRSARHAWQKRFFYLGIVGITALAACVAFAALPGLMIRIESDRVTTTGELGTYRLPDGSTVSLAPDSAIKSLDNGRERGAQVLRGEALFEVTHDPKRPFHVKAGGVGTTVLGTVFGVRRLQHGAVITVKEGRVQVETDAAAQPVSEQLGAGEWLRIDGDGAGSRGSMPVAEIAAWKSAQIIARDRTVADVVDEIRRSWSGAIVLASDGLAQQRVSGVYNLADPKAALSAAVGVHGGIVRQVSPWLLVVSTD